MVCRAWAGFAVVVAVPIGPYRGLFRTLRRECLPHASGSLRAHVMLSHRLAGTSEDLTDPWNAVADPQNI